MERPSFPKKAKGVLYFLAVKFNPSFKRKPLYLRSGVSIRLEDRATDIEGNSVAIEVVSTGTFLPDLESSHTTENGMEDFLGTRLIPGEVDSD